VACCDGAVDLQVAPDYIDVMFNLALLCCCNDETNAFRRQIIGAAISLLTANRNALLALANH
jgi:hypothetical protein